MAFIEALSVAGIMRHIFEPSSVDSIGKGAVSGLGIGLFLAIPWIMINNAFAGRSFRLILINSGYAKFGCAIIGLLLTLF